MFFSKRADANSTGPGIPKPRVVDPSGDYDGNDGKWSTFYVNLGDPDGLHSQGQNFKVLISTSSALTMIPAQTEWCNEDCAKRRGIQIYNGEQPLGYDSSAHSGTWKSVGIYTVPEPAWWDRDELNGTLGLDNVGLGQSSPSSFILGQQLVMTYIFEDFFLGSFGLATGSVAAGNSDRAPFLYNLAYAADKPENAIPSVSYGHTAGASYRNDNKGVVGNLVLGGYDSSRVNIQQGTSIKMPNEKNNTLVVGVQSILYQPDPDVEANKFSFTDKSKGFSATIDSTLPYLYLPDDVCDHFADRFGLVYDDKLKIYTVNSTAHRNNERNNATVSFNIGSRPETTDSFTEIVLPYAAFYLTLDKPAVENVTQYFPIRKSPNGIYVLGRTFLQEAYLIVDYERSNFTVAPVRYPDATQNSNTLVPIYNSTYTPPAQTPTLIPSGGGGGGGGGLSPGAVAGIVVGVVVVFLLAGLALFFRWKKRRQAKKNPYDSTKAEDLDTTIADREVKHFSELDSEPPHSPKPSISGMYRDQKDMVHFPPISEMDSPPVELPSPQPNSAYSDSNGNGDYFLDRKPRRRGATRESSGGNTPGTDGLITPVAELPGDDGKFQVGGVHFEPMASPKLPPAHARGPSDTSLHSKIDEVISRSEPSPERNQEATAATQENAEQSTGKAEDEAEPEISPERRPSQHTRGLSDSTVQSDNTAVSQPTPEELEQWALGGEEGPRRPLSE